jgi:tyrosyl-tRNA synthetase
LFPSLEEQMEVIRRGAAEIIPEEDLARKIKQSIRTNTPMNVKLGCDPSRPDLHLGHSVVLRKLRQFQDLGHQAILIIGDFTGMIGDPSGLSKTRPPLTLEETRKNGQTYFEQATKILSVKKVKMLYNSEWLSKMNFEEVIRLASKYTVARILERDDFAERYKAGDPISIHELLYPLAQAMDSVAIKADIELGGTDQKFNLLVGRDIQREFGQDPQVILTTPILAGTDGIEKMSKSLDNCIAITDPPSEIYGKTLSIPDNLILDYFLLTTNVSAEEIGSFRKQLGDRSVNPRDLKRRLARELVTLYCDEPSARRAEEEFDRIFVAKEVPENVENFTIRTGNGRISIIELLTATKLASSNSDARRLVQQGGVTIDGKKITDVNFVLVLDREVILKVGKRRFLKIINR